MPVPVLLCIRISEIKCRRMLSPVFFFLKSSVCHAEPSQQPCAFHGLLPPMAHLCIMLFSWLLVGAQSSAPPVAFTLTFCFLEFKGIMRYDRKISSLAHRPSFPCHGSQSYSACILSFFKALPTFSHFMLNIHVLAQIQTFRKATC